MNLVVLGVFWFRSETSTDSQVQSVNTPTVEMTQPVAEAKAQSTSTTMGDQPSEPASMMETVGADQEAILEEYWALLLGGKRALWCPSKRVDKFMELDFILSLDADQARNHIDAILALKNIRRYERDELLDPLIMQMARQDPTATVNYLAGSPHELPQDYYENVLRIWMDKEGESVTEWYEVNQGGDLEARFGEAFLTVYAEEDPYDYLVRYGTQDMEGLNRDAVELLYEEFGASAFESLKAEGFEPARMARYFSSFGQVMFREHPSEALNWIQTNRGTVDERTTKALAVNLLEDGWLPDGTLALETLEWALRQNVLSSNERSTKRVVHNMGRWNAQETRAALEQFQTQSGISTEELLEVLPKPWPEDAGIIKLKTFKVEQSEEIELLCGLSFEVSSGS